MTAIYSYSEQLKNLRAFMREHAADLTNYFNIYFNKLALQEAAQRDALLTPSKSDNKHMLPSQPTTNVTNQYRTFTVKLREITDNLINNMTNIVNNASIALQNTALQIMQKKGTSTANQQRILRSTHQATQSALPTLIHLLQSLAPGQPRHRPTNRVTHAAFKPRLDDLFNQINRDREFCEANPTMATDRQQAAFDNMVRFAYVHNFAESLFDSARTLELAEQERLYEDAAAVVFDPIFLQQFDEVFSRPMFNEVASTLRISHLMGLSDKDMLSALQNNMDERIEIPSANAPIFNR